jgi:hypothetical protein
MERLRLHRFVQLPGNRAFDRSRRDFFEHAVLDSRSSNVLPM